MEQDKEKILIYNKGNYVLRLLSILFFPQKYAYKGSYFVIEGIPIGWIIVAIALVIKLI